MRLGALNRLISGKTFEDYLDGIPTYELMQSWMTMVTHRERYLGSTLLGGPLWHTLRRPLVRIKDVEADIEALWTAIGQRYDGVIKQWLDRANTSKPVASNRVVEAFKNARSKLASSKQCHDVPVQLCRALIRALGNDDACVRKFYLRAFVDDIGAAEARGVVKASAFGYGASQLGGPQELFRLFHAGCEALHHRLLESGAALDVMTDRSITHAEVVASSADGPAVCGRWLLP